MEITAKRAGEFVEVSVKGRLDGYWSDHLTKELEEIMRQGADRIRLHLSEVSYISSLGVRVLLDFHKRLRQIQGTFAVASLSEPVKKVLSMTGLSRLLMPADAAQPAAAQPASARQLDLPGVRVEVFEIGRRASLRCRMIGSPDLLSRCGFSERDCRTMLFPETTLAFGLGAFGNGFHDCRDRFGEFLAVAGAAAYQPTDGSNVPDYLMSQGEFVPELQVLYGLVCEGPFAFLARFNATPEAGAVRLSDLAAAGLEIAGGDAAAMVIVGESGGLMGAALRRSPARAEANPTPLEYPEIRRWLSFSAERAHTRALVIAGGVAARTGSRPLGALVRPLGAETSPMGHFHAAAFPYRSLQRGHIELSATIRPVFEAGPLQGVLHLLGDHREAVGAGESEFIRGACWIGPVAEAVSEGT